MLNIICTWKIFRKQKENNKLLSRRWLKIQYLDASSERDSCGGMLIWLSFKGRVNCILSYLWLEIGWTLQYPWTLPLQHTQVLNPRKPKEILQSSHRAKHRQGHSIVFLSLTLHTAQDRSKSQSSPDGSLIPFSVEPERNALVEVLFDSSFCWRIWLVETIQS